MSTSRTINFFINTIFSFIYQVVVFISGLIIPKIMLSVFGSEINGLTSSISQFISYFTLVEAGLSSAAIFSLYRPLEQKNYKKINSIVKTTHVFYQKSGFVFIILSLIFAIIYAFKIKVDSLNYLQIVMLVAILSSSAIIDFFTLSKYRALLTADEKVYIISIGNIIYYVVYTIVIYLIAKFSSNIIVVRAVGISAVLLRTIFLKMYCAKKYTFLNLQNGEINKEYLGKRWDALYLQTLSSIHNGSPTIIATFFTSLVYVSVFSVYNMIVSGVGGIVGIFTSGLYANFGHVLATDDKNNTKSIYYQFETSFHLISTLVYSLTMVLIIPFIRIYTNGITDVNYIDFVLAVLIVLNGFIYNLKTPQGTMIIAAGHFKETRVQTTIQGVIAVIGGIVGAILWGLKGMMIGIVLSNIYRIIDVIFYVPKHITRTNPMRSIKITLISTIIFASSVAFAYSIPLGVSTYMEWLLLAIIAGIIILLLIVLVFVIFDFKCIKQVFLRIRKVIRNK